MTDITEKTINLNAIRELYQENQEARVAFDHFATRKRNKRETSVNRLLAVLEADGADVSYGGIRDFLRRLAELNCGVYMFGRRGKPSRLVWSVGLVSLGQAAAGQRSEVSELNGGDAADEDEETDEQESAGIRPGSLDMRISYPLRPDLNVELILPKSLTTREAQRLAEFIRSLPFDDGGGGASS